MIERKERRAAKKQGPNDDIESPFVGIADPMLLLTRTISEVYEHKLKNILVQNDPRILSRRSLKSRLRILLAWSWVWYRRVELTADEIYSLEPWTTL